MSSNSDILLEMSIFCLECGKISVLFGNCVFHLIPLAYTTHFNNNNNNKNNSNNNNNNKDGWVSCLILRSFYPLPNGNVKRMS